MSSSSFFEIGRIGEAHDGSTDGFVSDAHVRRLCARDQPTSRAPRPPRGDAPVAEDALWSFGDLCPRLQRTGVGLAHGPIPQTVNVLEVHASLEDEKMYRKGDDYERTILGLQAPRPLMRVAGLCARLALHVRSRRGQKRAQLARFERRFRDDDDDGDAPGAGAGRGGGASSPFTQARRLQRAGMPDPHSRRRAKAALPRHRWGSQQSMTLVWTVESSIFGRNACDTHDKIKQAFEADWRVIGDYLRTTCSQQSVAELKGLVWKQFPRLCQVFKNTSAKSKHPFFCDFKDLHHLVRHFEMFDNDFHIGDLSALYMRLVQQKRKRAGLEDAYEEELAHGGGGARKRSRAGVGAGGGGERQRKGSGMHRMNSKLDLWKPMGAGFSADDALAATPLLKDVLDRAEFVTVLVNLAKVKFKNLIGNEVQFLTRLLDRFIVPRLDKNLLQNPDVFRIDRLYFEQTEADLGPFAHIFRAVYDKFANTSFVALGHKYGDEHLSLTVVNLLDTAAEQARLEGARRHDDEDFERFTVDKWKLLLEQSGVVQKGSHAHQHYTLRHAVHDFVFSKPTHIGGADDAEDKAWSVVSPTALDWEEFLEALCRVADAHVTAGEHALDDAAEGQRATLLLRSHRAEGPPDQSPQLSRGSRRKNAVAARHQGPQPKHPSRRKGAKPRVSEVADPNNHALRMRRNVRLLADLFRHHVLTKKEISQSSHTIVHREKMQHLQHRRTAALTSDIAAEIADLARRQVRRTLY